MVKIKPEGFNGFSPETLVFLKGLEENNNKVWFEEHKQDYREYLLEPQQRLVADMSEFMLTIDPHFETRPAINKTISRIYRDTRFSRDKSPLKTSVWLVFKRPGKNWKDAPAYFFEIASNGYRYGMGFYSASKTTLDSFRGMIDDNPDEFMDIISFYRKQQVFNIAGERYKRVLDPSKPAKIQEWYQRRNIFLVCHRDANDRLFGRQLIDELIVGFRQLVPLYHYLWKATAAS